MGLPLAYKILEAHLVSGKLGPGAEIEIRIDQTLTQDATGTLTMLEFEALKKDRVEVELAVSYVDHNTLQIGFENMDDHIYLKSAAARFGIVFSKPGNGICHQVHLERFGLPGKTLIGSDSHTPTAGGLGMLALGVGGLSVAAAMAGNPYTLTCPRVMGIYLSGRLGPWVSAKDVILEVLRRIGVKGGVGSILEYFGPGAANLSVPERATIANMGAETGATSSIFPADEMTLDWLNRQGRNTGVEHLAADEDADYHEVMEIDLSEIAPLVALPSSPDNVVNVADVEGEEVRQVAIGSCTNSSFRDLSVVAEVLRGGSVHPDVSLSISPGSRQVVMMLADSGRLGEIIGAGARLLEPACNGCIGMGSAPATGIASVRTFNRNFPGRSGTRDDRVFLTSPETAAATALTGRVTDPRSLGDFPEIETPETFPRDDSMLIFPPLDGAGVEVIRGPNIQPLPLKEPLPENLAGEVLIKVGHHVSTDHIMPAGAKVLPLRSNVPAICRFVFQGLDPSFPERCEELEGGFVVAGENYGQGSSREHAALAPMHLGVKAVLALSFARIHRANLINFGILPLTFRFREDYEKLDAGDKIELPGVKKRLAEDLDIEVSNLTKNESYLLNMDAGPRELEILLDGGLLNHLSAKSR